MGSIERPSLGTFDIMSSSDCCRVLRRFRDVSVESVVAPWSSPPAAARVLIAAVLTGRGIDLRIQPNSNEISASGKE